MQIKHFFIFILVSSCSLLFFYCTSDKAPRQTQSLEYDMISIKDSDIKTLIKYDSLGQKLIEGSEVNHALAPCLMATKEPKLKH